jgi:transposase
LAVIRYAKIHGAKHRPWITALLTRRPTKVTAIALANKIRQNGMGDRGEPRVCSMVPVPDEADEDSRRCIRERTETTLERGSAVSGALPIRVAAEQ